MKYQDDDKHDIFTQEKITILLRLLNKSCLLKQKKIKRNGLVFHWCLCNNENIT